MVHELYNIIEGTMKHREHLIKAYKAKGELSGLGYYLDSVDDWDIVAEIPIEIEEKILDLRSQGFNRVSITNTIEPEYANYVEFVFLYHA